MSSIMIAAVALQLVPCGTPNPPNALDDKVVVFRYAPSLMGPYQEAQSQDVRQIWQALKDREIAYRAETQGGVTTVCLSPMDISRWIAMVDKLIETGVLRYYRWGTDIFGYGLVPVR
ncbi:MAG TPA: hypothetical protein VKE40_13435 [Gemmataceae bacterium]|nr:hypothetical protein [Gemmataceae bacterium]